MSTPTESGAHASRRELRNFGLLLGALFALIFGALPALRGHRPAPCPFALAAVAWMLALFAPATLGPIHRAWVWLGLALGWLNTRLVLGLMFFGLIVPTGLVMRFFGRDKMGRRFDPGLGSYRIASRRRSPESMEKPY